MIAWNGECCNMRRIYMVAQAPNTTLSPPDEIQYFLDSISQYQSYKLNIFKSFIERNSLSVVWKYKEETTRGST